jgi:ketosteroid isomerase-like protein
VTAGASTDNMATIRRFYDLVMSGDLESACAMLDENVVVHEPAELPYGGEFRGVAEWREMVAREMSLIEVEFLTPNEFREVDSETLLVTAKVRFTSKTSGRSTDTAVVELLKVSDGRVTEFDVYYKDPAAVAGLAP